MGLTPGQNLVSGSENTEKTNRRNLSFDPFVGATRPSVDPTFFQGLRDLATNTVFNVVDSALFGVPGRKLEQNAEVTRGGFFERERRTFGGAWDSLGIKPYEELSGAGKFGLGLGQAAGFFVPFSGIAKAGRIAQKFAFGNANKLIGETVENVIKGTASSNPLRSIIKNTIAKESDRLPHIFRAGPEQAARFENTLLENVRLAATKFSQDNGLNIAQKEIDDISGTVIKSIRELGENGKFIDDLEGLTAGLGKAMGDNAYTRTIAGYAGRAVDQSVNMAIYEGLGHLSRAAAGAEYDDVDYDLLDSMKNSAGFAAAITLADFIPGGRKAGGVQDFYRFARQSLGKNRDWLQLYKDGKVTKDQLNSIAAWLSRQGKTLPNVAGKTSKSRGLEVGRMEGEDIAGWLNNIYSENRTELLRAIMKDGGKSLVHSLPRAAVDGLVTATYMNGTENFMEAIHDESMMADYLVGAFMAMRAYSPLDRRKQMRWRYDTSIDSKFSFMESMGMDISHIAGNADAMNRVMADIDIAARNLETTSSAEEIYSALYQERGTPSDESAGSNMKERALADQLMQKFIPMYIKRNDIHRIDEIQMAFEKGVVPNVYNMSDAQFSDMWNSLKDIQTPEGRSIAEYADLGIDRWREDYEAPIYKNHIDALVLHSKRAANELDKLDNKGSFIISDNTAEGGKLRLRRITGNLNNPELSFIVDSFRELEKGDVVEFDKSRPAIDISNVDNQVLANIKRITDDYMNDSADFFGSNLNYSAFDNPALDYIAEYNNLKVKNKIEDAILGNDREGDRVYGAIREAISEKIGETVSAKGIRIKLTDEEDPNIPIYNRLVNELVGMKRAAAKTNSSDSIREISLEDARDLYNDLESLGYTHYSKDNDMIYFGGLNAVEFKNRLQEGVISRSGLNRTDFVVFNYIKDEFGSDGSGKVQMPSMKYAEQVLRENLANFQEKDILNKTEMDALTPVLREYQKALDRMSKTGRVQIVNSRTGDDTSNTMESVIYAIRDIYDAEARGEIHDFGKLASEKVAKYESLMGKLNEFLTKEYTHESKENVEEVAKYISDNAAEITEISNLFTNDQGNKRKGFTEVLAQAERIATRQAQDINTESFLSRVFNEVFEGVSEVEDMTRAVAKLASVEKSKIGFGVSAQKLRSDLLKIYDERTRKEMENNSLEEAFLEFASRRGVTEAKNLVENTYRYINTDSNISDHLFVGESSTKDMMDMLRFFSGSSHSASKQSLVARMQELGLNHLLDKQDISSDLVAGLVDPERVESTTRDLIEQIKSKLTESEFNNKAEKITKEINATITTLSRRNRSYRSAKLQGDSFVFNSDEKSVHTPIGEFTNDAKYDIFIIKDSMVIDGVSRKITDMTLDKAKETIFNATSSIEKSVFENLRDREKFASILEVAKSGDQTKFPVFVPLQSNEDVGVVFSKTEDNVRRLKKEFNQFSLGLFKEAKEFNRIEALQMHMDVIDGMLKDASDEGISAAIRSMYYHNNISKDMFWQMIGEGNSKASVAESARRGQIKNFKYISHVNSKNAISFDKASLNLIEKATNVFKDYTTIDRSILTELKRRQKDGIRVFVYNDEVEDANGNRVKGTTAYDIIANTVSSTLDDLGLVGSQRAEMEKRLVESTARDYGMDTDAESLKQSIVDGVSFASLNAMKLDAYLMGKNFDDGVTAAKIQFHNAEYSFIGKTAVRFNELMEAFMKDKGIDYIVPASSAKSWMNKDKINAISEWNNTKSVGDNIKEQFTTINDFSLRSFTPETIKYLYPTHGGDRPQSNTNTSVMHFLDELAVSDYTNQLGIEQIVQSISRNVSNARNKMFTGGIEGLFNRNNEGTDTYFSHYSAIEQMIKWGIDSDNTLVRDSIMRFVRDTQYKSLLSKPRTDVVNTFLFTDSTLKSPIYESSGSQGHVKSFGEVRLPYYSGKESITSDTSYIFTVVRNGDFQDVLFNAGKGKLNVHSANKNFDISDISTDKQLSQLYKSLSDYGNYDAVNNKLSEINLVLSGRTDGVYEHILNNNKYEYVKNEELSNLVLSLREKGLRNFSLAANSHKIPKKFAADSIVNRIAGFNTENAGDLIEANNYETALQHQADQDGDKMTSYMKMPFSVLRSSSNNMALAKDAITVDPNNVAFPNVFGTITNDDNITNVGDTNSARANNPLKYMSNERRSKYVVGTTVKTQGSVTMLDITGMRFLGNPIMKFGNSEGGDFGKSSDFARITGSITQSILDAWNGVHDSLLSSRKIKDYILFGEKSDIPIDKIPKTLPVGEGFQGIFPINESGFRGSVYKDFVREIYNSFEDVYTSLGDVYEGGVAVKPEFHHLARSYYNLRNLMNKDSSYVFNKLAARYKRQSRWDELNFLKDQFQTSSNRSSEATLKTIFSFDKSFDDMIKIHPQLKALHEIVQQGDLLRNDDYQIREDDVKKFFDYKDGSIMTRIMGSKENEFASTILALNDGEVVKILDNIEQLDGVSPNHARNLGLINHVLENKINQLQYSKNFYERTQNTDAQIDVDIELSLLREKQREVHNKIYKTIKSTFVNDANIVDVISTYRNNNDNNTWLYKDTGASYEFVKVLRPGEYAPGWISGKGFVLQNPIELKPLNKKEQVEGFAMHNTVDNFYDSIVRSKNGNIEKANEVVGLLRQKIEMTKHNLREINSDTFDSLAKIPAMKSDIYDQSSIYTHLEMEKFLTDIRDFAEANNITHEDVLKAALSPRLIPNEIIKDGNVEVNSFKIDKKFTMALIKHINDNTSELVSDYKIPLSRIMTDYAERLQVGNGIQPEGKHSGTYVDKDQRINDYLEANQANSLFHSLNKTAQNDIMLRRAIEGMTFTRKTLNDDGTVTKTARNVKKKQTEIGCKLI